MDANRAGISALFIFGLSPGGDGYGRKFWSCTDNQQPFVTNLAH